MYNNNDFIHCGEKVIKYSQQEKYLIIRFRYFFGKQCRTGFKSSRLSALANKNRMEDSG